MEIKEKLKHWSIMVLTNRCLGCCLFCEWWDMCKWETEDGGQEKEIMIQKHPKDWHEVLTKETER